MERGASVFKESLVQWDLALFACKEDFAADPKNIRLVLRSGPVARSGFGLEWEPAPIPYV